MFIFGKGGDNSAKQFPRLVLGKTQMFASEPHELENLLQTIELFCKPKATRCDNEPIFKSRLFHFSLKVFGFRQQFNALGCHWKNGRVERLFGTLKQELDQITLSILDICAM